jgi:hypothetical protein
LTLGKLNKKKIMSEINIWAKPEHDNIVRYKSSWIEIGDWTHSNENDTTIVKNQEILYIQMELCQMTLRKAFTQICKELNQNYTRGMTIIGASSTENGKANIQ